MNNTTSPVIAMILIWLLAIEGGIAIGIAFNAPSLDMAIPWYIISCVPAGISLFVLISIALYSNKQDAERR